jgi:uncharacterized membrane protein YfhO
MVGPFYADKNHHIRNVLIFILSYLGIYFIILQLLNKFKVVVGLLLFGLICSELIIENYPTFYRRGIVEKNGNPYKSETAKLNEQLIKNIKRNDKSLFYRIEKEYYLFGGSLTQNDALIFDYYGLKTYNTFGSKTYYEFCQFFKLGEKDQWPNILPSLESKIERKQLFNILSVKYLLSKDSIFDKSFILIDEKKDVKVYKNINYLPLGYTYTNFITKQSIGKYFNSLKDSLIQSHIIIEDKNKETLVKYLNNFKPNIQKKFKIRSFSNSLIKGSICNQSKSILYFSIPYDDGWEIKVNGVKSKYYKVNIGFIGLPLEKGFNKIELSYTPPMLREGFIISISTMFFITLFMSITFLKHKKINNKIGT